MVRQTQPDWLMQKAGGFFGNTIILAALVGLMALPPTADAGEGVAYLILAGFGLVLRLVSLRRE